MTNSTGSLAGKEVLVTRAEGVSGPLSTRLEALGASPVYWPVIQFLPPIDNRPFEQSIAAMDAFDWIVFSSPRAVEAVTALVEPPSGLPAVASVGSSTSEALLRAGWSIDLEAEPARSAALVASLRELGCEGKKILFPASAIARPTIQRGLSSVGAEVRQVIAYRTVPAALDREACRRKIGSRSIAAVTFASPSAVEGLREVLGEESFQDLMSYAARVAIGPTTAEALSQVGHGAHAVAAESRVESLAEAVVIALHNENASSRRT